MTFIEIAIYLGLFSLITVFVAAIAARTVRGNAQLYDQNLIRQEASFMIEKINYEALKARRFGVLPDWGVVLEYPDASLGYFRLKKSVSQANDIVSGHAFNYAAGYISVNCADHATSTCPVDYKVTYLATSTPAEYRGWAWSPAIGWISFNCINRQDPCGISYKVSDGSATSTGTELSGWAWNDIVGWISFNCANRGTCGTVDYRVIRQSDGYLSGYAWNDVVGWIGFDGAGGDLVLRKGSIELPLNASGVSVAGSFTKFSSPDVISAVLTTTRNNFSLTHQFSVTNHGLK